MEVGYNQDLSNAEKSSSALNCHSLLEKSVHVVEMNTCPPPQVWSTLDGCGSSTFSGETSSTGSQPPISLSTENLFQTADKRLGPYLGDGTCLNKQINVLGGPIEMACHDGENNACGDVMNSELCFDETTPKFQKKFDDAAVAFEENVQVGKSASSTSAKAGQYDSKSETPELNFHITISDDDEEEDPDDFLLLESHTLLDNETPCLLCDHIETDLDSNKAHYDGFLCHLIVEHHLVIADVNLISDLRSYAIHWKNRFQQTSMEDYCSKILSNCGPKDVAQKEEYFLLCDALSEDKKVREELQIMKLKQMLLRQEFERKDNTFERACLFCSKSFHGNRLVLFNHMTTDHGFNAGHPDNIVNVREFLDLIESKLDNLQCLLCENNFKDRLSLREHMRKKLHRKLNPKNKEYDKFYIINYLEFGKNWEKIHNEPNDDREFDDWSGWHGKLPYGTCFFCKESNIGVSSIYDHMQEKHGFDFLRICQEMRMSFYQQVKMINYIRRQVIKIREAQPEKDYDRLTNEIAKLMKERVVESSNWNQPQFYFPAVEDDAFLCSLDENKGLFEPEDTYVISEDIDLHKVIESSVLTDMVVTGQFEDYTDANYKFNNGNTPERRPLFAFPWTMKINQ